MRLFQRHRGRQGVAVKSAPASLDVAASRTGDTLFLHVANRSYDGATAASFAVDRAAIVGGRVRVIAPENPRQEISPLNPDVFKPQEHPLPKDQAFAWRFPARSVSAVELELRPA
jgi:hypothetical protein